MKVKKASVTRGVWVRRRGGAMKMERKTDRQVILLFQGAKKLDFRLSVLGSQRREGVIQE